MIWNPKTTWLHHVNPSLKFLLSLMLMISLLFVHNINIMINCTLCALLFFLFGSGLKGKQASLFLLPFLFLFFMSAISMTLYGKGATIWFQWGIISISEESFYRGIQVGLRALCFGLIGLLFAITTPPVPFFYSLMQQLHCKPKYAYSFMAAIRLIPMIWQEFQTIRMAHKVRGFHAGHGWNGIIRKLKAYAIPLLSQSIRRAYRTAIAMESKRFVGNQKRTYYYEMKLGKIDLWFVLILLSVVSLIYIITMNFNYVSITDVRFR